MYADVLIIGGGPSGIVTALTARKNYPDKKIVVLRKEDKVVIPCAIPYLSSSIESVSKNIVSDEILTKNDIELLKGEAKSINRGKKYVETTVGKISYDKLVLATGATPQKIPIEGIELENVFFIKKEVPYLEKLFRTVREVQNIVVIGGGFVGVEFSTDIVRLKKKISIVELLPHVVQLNFDDEFCMQIEEKLKEMGINVYTNTRVEKIIGERKVEKVLLSNGKELEADMVIVSVGLRPNVELARNAEINIGRCGIVVDDYGRTNDPDVFAVGDCVERRDFITGGCRSVMLASLACRDARVVGSNLFEMKRLRRIVGDYPIFSTIIGDTAFGCAGLTERQAKEMKIEVVSGEFLTVNRHPGCLPDAKQIKIKLLFDKKSHLLLGGQVSGDKAVAEITNLIGVALQAKFTCEDIYLMEVGTHPMLTSSPIVYPIIKAAEDALMKLSA